MKWGIELAERGRLPDEIVRFGIRRFLARRLTEVDPGDCESRANDLSQFVVRRSQGPIAESVAAANRQHYEVPAEFFELLLGPRLKYSSCLWPAGVVTLAGVEDAMLSLTHERAEIADGMDVLDLGCGWGSFSLWLAERRPKVRVLSISNSHSQCAYITERAAELGLANLTACVVDVNNFQYADSFDRVVSVEMFEHVRNHAELLGRIARSLRRGGKLFVHHFCHRQCGYEFGTAADDDWMGRHFFTGGIMPPADFLLHFPQSMHVERHWLVDGRHYAQTLEAWLARLDAQREHARAILAAAGESDPDRAVNRWRMFLMACAELFTYRGGQEWFVAHCLLAPCLAARV